MEIDEEERLVVVAELAPTADAGDVEAIARAVRESVAREHQVQTYAVLLLPAGALPRTASNKIERHACREGFLKGSLPVTAKSIVAPTTAEVLAPNSGLTRARLLALPAADQLPALEHLSFLRWLGLCAAQRSISIRRSRWRLSVSIR